MKEKLEQIRKKCIEANPEIVELKFGCEISDGEFNFVIYRETKQNFWTKELNERSSVFQFSKPLEGFEIIGRPIHLADVLLAINNGELTSKHDGKWVESVVELLLLWNLKKTFDHQSDETIDFIYELLK